MTARYVRYTFIPETINRCGKLSVLRFVTLTLGDGTMVRCYRHDQKDGGIAHTFQPCSTETFKSPSGTIYQRGYGLYVVDDASDEFFSVTNSADVLNSLLESFRQDGISVKHATVCDEVIPCTSKGNLMDKKLYTLTTSFTVSSDYKAYGVQSITPRCNDSQSSIGKKRSRTSRVRSRATGQLQANRL